MAAQPDKYPNVKKAHIVPRTYLKKFATDDQIEIRLVDTGDEKLVSIDDAAVRRYFYRRYRPDGTPIDDVEWSLAQLEGAVAELLHSVEAEWPLEREDKHKLAELFAFQAVRGPRWRQWHDDFTRNAVAEEQANRDHRLDSGLYVPKPPGTDERLAADLLSDTKRLESMMVAANRLIHVYGSMRWDLLVFDGPVLALSDHPVVEWPMAVKERRVGLIQTGYGVINVLEVRIPLSPSTALLMTWQDSRDGELVKPGTDAHATNINALTVEQAEKQWMRQPGTSPETTEGLVRPISQDLFQGYVPIVAESTRTRSAVHEIVNAKLGEGLSEEAQTVRVDGVGLD